MNNYNGVEILCCEDRKFFNKLINHPKVIEAYEERKKHGVLIMTEWNMVNGSTLNFSEIGKLDGFNLYESLPKPLTHPKKRDTIAPSTLLVKLIGRIYED